MQCSLSGMSTCQITEAPCTRAFQNVKNFEHSYRFPVNMSLSAWHLQFACNATQAGTKKSIAEVSSTFNTSIHIVTAMPASLAGAHRENLHCKLFEKRLH